MKANRAQKPPNKQQFFQGGCCRGNRFFANVCFGGLFNNMIRMDIKNAKPGLLQSKTQCDGIVPKSMLRSKNTSQFTCSLQKLFLWMQIDGRWCISAIFPSLCHRRGKAFLQCFYCCEAVGYEFCRIIALCFDFQS